MVEVLVDLDEVRDPQERRVVDHAERRPDRLVREVADEPAHRHPLLVTGQLGRDLPDQIWRDRGDDVPGPARVEVDRQRGDELPRQALCQVDRPLDLEQRGDPRAQQRPERMLGDHGRQGRRRQLAGQRDQLEAAAVDVEEDVARPLADLADLLRTQSLEVGEPFGRRPEQSRELEHLGMTGKAHLAQPPQDDSDGPAEPRRQPPESFGDRRVGRDRLVDASLGHRARQVAALVGGERFEAIGEADRRAALEVARWRPRPHSRSGSGLRAAAPDPGRGEQPGRQVAFGS